MSVDILSFFKQLLPVLENDESVYCLSAWNDQVIKLSPCIRDLKIRLRRRRRRRQQHGVNSRFFNLHRDYSKSLTLSNVGALP